MLFLIAESIDAQFVGRRYGIDAKDFTQICVEVVFNNIVSNNSKNKFTVKLSGSEFDLVPHDNTASDHTCWSTSIMVPCSSCYHVSQWTSMKHIERSLPAMPSFLKSVQSVQSASVTIHSQACRLAC